jgi:hypothetical protein
MTFPRRALSLACLLSALTWSGPVGAQDQPRFTVSGVVIKEGAGVAWIGEPSYTKNRLLRVREGDHIGPYRVAAIREDRVELTGPSGPVVVRLSASAPDMPAELAPGAVAAAPPDGRQGSGRAQPGAVAAGRAQASGTPGTRVPPRGPLTEEQEARALKEIQSNVESMRALEPKNSGWRRFMGSAP